MPEMSIDNFIDTVILDEMNKIIKVHGFHYLGFILVANAIEFVGSLLDQNDFNKPRLSKKRFNRLIKECFPEEYKKYTDKDSNNNLYENLRCGMVHFMCPDVGVALTHRKESEHYHTTHLKPDKYGSVVLVIEDLYDDLCQAIKKIRSDQYRSRIQKDLSKPYLGVPEKIVDNINCLRSTPTSGSSTK